MPRLCLHLTLALEISLTCGTTPASPPTLRRHAPRTSPSGARGPPRGGTLPDGARGTTRRNRGRGEGSVTRVPLLQMALGTALTRTRGRTLDPRRQQSRTKLAVERFSSPLVVLNTQGLSQRSSSRVVMSRNDTWRRRRSHDSLPKALTKGVKPKSSAGRPSRGRCGRDDAMKSAGRREGEKARRRGSSGRRKGVVVRFRVRGRRERTCAGCWLRSLPVRD